MKRRAFGLLAGVTATTVALQSSRLHAQAGDRVRRIGVLMDLAADNPDGQARLAAFRGELSRLGWIDGSTVVFDVRWGSGGVGVMRTYAEELVALKPDVMLAAGSLAVAPLRQMQTIRPVVFATVIDPVGAGFVATVARPGGSITGFTALEFSIGTKWLSLLKEIDPHITRVAVLHDTALASGNRQFAAIQSVASSFAVEVIPVDMRDTGEIERALDAVARGPKGALIVTASTLSVLRRDPIIAQASLKRLPAIYSDRLFVIAGGLLAYSADRIDQFRQAAGYVSRILRGEKPADLPVQAPTKYELVINLRTARSLGLEMPRTMLAGAHEIIE